MNLVAENKKSGSKLPLHRQPIKINPELLTSEVASKLKALDICTREGDIKVDFAWLLLEHIEDSFTSKRIQRVIIDELKARLIRAKSDNSRRFLRLHLEGLEETKVGSYDPSWDMPYVPKSKI